MLCREHFSGVIDALNPAGHYSLIVFDIIDMFGVKSSSKMRVNAKLDSSRITVIVVHICYTLYV